MVNVRRIAGTRLRRLVLPVLARVNPGDITLRHPYTGDRLRLHSFRHRGYWFHGKTREQETMALFARYVTPGSTVAEVGGHIGFISQYFASLVGEHGRVVVFEPGPNNLPYLRRNVGHMTNVRVVEAGVAAEEGEATLYVEHLTGQNNSMVENFAGLTGNAEAANVKADVSSVTISLTTLDLAIGHEDVDFIKVDVEGFELEVLLGAEKVLSEQRPILMVEVQRHVDQLADLARRHRYVTVDENLQPVNLLRLGGMTMNTFWLPENA